MYQQSSSPFERSRPVSQKPTDLEFFSSVAARLSRFVREATPDMRDCENASNELQEYLLSVGYFDAYIVGCSVSMGVRENPGAAECGKFHVVPRSWHYVVVVKDHLIDATVGQFRKPGVPAPDCLVMPNARRHLDVNRKFVLDGGGDLTYHIDRASGLAIGYFPDAPAFEART